MKKLFYLFVISAVATTAACKKKITATEYNNKIINEQSKVLDLVLEFNAKIDQDSFAQARSLLDKTVVQCDSSINTIDALGEFDGDAAFKNAAIDLFKFYKRIFSQDYKELLDIIEMSEPTDGDYLRAADIAKKIENEEKVVDDKIQSTQKAFADKHNVIITDNDLQEKIDNIEKE